MANPSFRVAAGQNGTVIINAYSAYDIKDELKTRGFTFVDMQGTGNESYWMFNGSMADAKLIADWIKANNYERG